MVEGTKKMIVVPIDGSENALKSLDYINRIFGPKHNLKLSLVYLVPKLPSILVEESSKSLETKNQLRKMEKRNSQMAERILTDAKDRLMNIGFTKKTVGQFFEKLRSALPGTSVVGPSRTKRQMQLSSLHAGQPRGGFFYRRNCK